MSESTRAATSSDGPEPRLQMSAKTPDQQATTVTKPVAIAVHPDPRRGPRELSPARPPPPLQPQPGQVPKP
ncbi:hypothetical protein FS837_010581 [Tulasnella sp. UAMH 9824]|nr:hypothetical protein FS837_010581 [Tulasnella sp. UAMH 9824]